MDLSSLFVKLVGFLQMKIQKNLFLFVDIVSIALRQMEKDNCSQVEFQQILNKIHSDLSKHGEFGKNMSKSIEDRTRKMLLFQTQIARFNKLLEHDEQEIQENELVELCAVINKEFGIGLNAFTIQQFKQRELPQEIAQASLIDQYATVHLAVCEYLKLLESFQLCQKHIQKYYLVIWGDLLKIIIGIH
ncbi:Hypothetical_protein [Hexamita inflata]|uniref:Hypothetical_protein n=1 Tax=Hexamita inflata TaxID=28002 RepID=A0AA86PWT2_9EUKA|nr:Hypothetical protein HINF_LOCUS33237 [Hexamita inflata]